MTIKENGRYVIVRGDRSGVFAGSIVARSGTEVTLENFRRIWYWSGAASISEIAQYGVKKPENCKFTVEVSRGIILDAVEILDVTPEAETIIKAVPIWRA